MTELPNSPAPLVPNVSQKHPRALYTLFFTEMWERFSYYGMRALLVLFMVDAVRGGMGLTDKVATSVYGLYTAAVYLMSLPGGWLSDRIFGPQRTVWYGGIIIALGHFTLAIPRHETFYLGLVLVVIGSGILKPNMSALVGELYPEGGSRRDAGFTIFYMGVNLGAFIGPLVCSTLGEKINWHYGFGAAGVGMVLGLIQFRLSRGLLGTAGLKRGSETPLRPFEKIGLAVAVAAVVCTVGLGMSGAIRFNPVLMAHGATYVIVAIGGLYFFYAFFLAGLSKVEKERIAVILVLFLTSALFWCGFEQTGSSFNLFAKRYTVRTTGFDFSTFTTNDVRDVSLLVHRLAEPADGVSKFVSTSLITKKALGDFALSSIGDPGPARLTLTRGLNEIIGGDSIYDEQRFAGVRLSPQTQALVDKQRERQTRREQLTDDEQVRLNRFLLEDVFPTELTQNQNRPVTFVVPAGWFQSLGATFIVLFAPVFAAIWVRLARRNLDPSIPVKFALGLFFLALGFVVMAGAAAVVAAGHKAWPAWLSVTYLLHTFGELCLSPVGLSSVTKLAPRRLVGQMMGIWFLGTSLGNLLAGLLAGEFDPDRIQQWPEFFLRVAIPPILAGLLLIAFAKPIKRWMVGVK
jgi:POT family proton-dependent oligopeptide transporter